MRPIGWTRNRDYTRKGVCVRHSLAAKGVKTRNMLLTGHTKAYDVYLDKKGKTHLYYGKDSDGDGVPDRKDCSPHDASRQDGRLRKNRDVAIAFASGRTSGSTDHLFIEGDTIYSYGYHFPIATRYGNKVWFTKKGYSNTTSRHKSLVLNALNIAGFEVEMVDDPLEARDRATGHYLGGYQRDEAAWREGI
jgi:hypothetical protein